MASMSISAPEAGVSKRRLYRLGKRAQKQAETRRRIVEAAVDLHSTVGPARTSVAQIAVRAGVQRHTYYAHFPDERSLLLACSGFAMERDPLPDVEQWAALAPGAERIRRGLEELYAWYERNAAMMSCVLRDAEFDGPTREIVELRMGATFRRLFELLGEGMAERSQALLGVALDFGCWRVLGRTHGRTKAAAVMADAIVGLAP